MIASFFVPGVPVPQGSKRAFARGGKAWLVEANPRHKDWRSTVSAHALEARPAGSPILDGPISITLHFQFIRPKSCPKKRTRPEVKPDIDKLVRAVADSITGILIRDDAQIVDLVARKVYADCAGVHVRIEEAL